MSAAGQDAEFLTALANDRHLLRKFAHWSGTLSVSTIVTRGSHISEVVLAPGRGVSAGDSGEVVLMGRVRQSDAAAAPSAARWFSVKQVAFGDFAPAPGPATVVLDGVPVAAQRWSVAGCSLLVVHRGDTRYEVWVPAGATPELVPLGRSDQIELAWSHVPEGS